MRHGAGLGLKCRETGDVHRIYKTVVSFLFYFLFLLILLAEALPFLRCTIECGHPYATHTPSLALFSSLSVMTSQLCCVLCVCMGSIFLKYVLNDKREWRDTWQGK